MQTPIHLQAYQLMHELINAVRTNHGIGTDEFSIAQGADRRNGFMPIVEDIDAPNIAVSDTNSTVFGMLLWLRGDKFVMLELRKLDNQWIMSLDEHRDVATLVDRDPSLVSAAEWLAGEIRRQLAV